ncbi:vegetative incompatibility WD repeat [Brachionus plicatilis]|uniref:Vegetative incompatibility WD repeat n=1 Tax=Brachionus plicatilis TaxID=10195 RepID=A0A3M7SFN6_BRAPC|nr:vegetative incompatibility WD repeat [Brachionus plicatilis]
METKYIIFYQILAIMTFNCYCKVFLYPRGLTSLNSDLASESNDRSLKIWKRYSGIYEMDRYPAGVSSIAVLKNSELAIVITGNKIEIWNTIGYNPQILKFNLTLRTTLDGHSDWIWCLAVLNNGDLASASHDKTIKIWNTNSGELKIILIDHFGPVTSLAVLNNGFLASGSTDTTINFWNPIHNKPKFSLYGQAGRILCLVVLQNGDLAAGYNDSLIKIWNTNNKSFNYILSSQLGQVTYLKKTLSGHSDKVYSLAILKNGDLASGSGDKTIKIWNTNNFELINTLNGHSNNILCLAVLKNGDLASGSQDETIKIWNLNSGNVRMAISNIRRIILSLAVDENGDLVAGFNGFNFDERNLFYIFNMSSLFKEMEKNEKILSKESERTKEGDKCDFNGYRVNQDDCQEKIVPKGYFYCKDNKLTKKQCIDNKLFDEKSKTCKEYKDVFCGNRPFSNDKKVEKDEKNLCSSRQDGYYPNIKNDCSREANVPMD